MPWDFFYEAISGLRAMRADGIMGHPTGVKAVCMMGSLRRERLENGGGPLSMPLLSLLEELRDFESTIAADKIYAVLGLVDAGDRVPVDYAKSSEQVFTDFAVGRLRAGSLDVLTHCVFSPRPSALVDLPSWVPDWTRPGAVEPFRIRGLRVSAAGSTRPQVTAIDAVAGVLELRGRLLDAVEAVDEAAHIPRDESDDMIGFTKTNPNGTSPGFQTPQERNALHEATQNRRIKASLDNIMRNMVFQNGTFTWEQYEAAWRTFMCNRTRDNEVPGPGYGPLWEQYMAFFSFDGRDPTEILQEMGVEPTPFPDSQKPDWARQEAHTGNSPALDTGASCEAPEDDFGDSLLRSVTAIRRRGGGLDKKRRPEPVENESELYATMRRTFNGAHSKWCYRRRFYRSREGRYGWVVDGCRSGDVVALFYGCDYPFVLRHQDGGTYRIIGDCYIHGLMDGEGLGAEYPEETFRLI